MQNTQLRGLMLGVSEGTSWRRLPLTASLAALLAALVLALIGLLSRRPVRVFRLVATGVLVLSFVMPLTISGAPLAMILSLEAMHVVAWTAAVGLLTTLARRTQPEGAQR
jgi:hypothetical protein